MPLTWDSTALEPVAALRRLAAGNARFRTSSLAGTSVRPWTPQLATEAQRPFAIVLGCSDSRTPVEILFDQGFGELFVVRIAGNVVAPSVVGSIEFAAAEFGTRLVVVMGHTRCGAVRATIRALETDDDGQSRNIRSITDRIAPHIEHLVDPSAPNASVLEAAVAANVRASADHLRHGSRLLEDLVLAERVVIVGANYELETGRVVFFDGLPDGLDPAELEG